MYFECQAWLCIIVPELGRMVSQAMTKCWRHTHTYTHTKLYFEWSYSFLYHQLPFSTNLRLKRIGMCLQWTCLDYFMLSLFPEYTAWHLFIHLYYFKYCSIIIWEWFKVHGKYASYMQICHHFIQESWVFTVFFWDTLRDYKINYL